MGCTSATLTDLIADEYASLTYDDAPKMQPSHEDVKQIKTRILLSEIIEILGYPQRTKNYYSVPSVRYSLNDECSIFIVYGKDFNMKKIFCLLLTFILLCSSSGCASAVLTDLTADEYASLTYDDEPIVRPSHEDVKKIKTKMLLSEVIQALGYPQSTKNYYSVPSVRYSLNDECSVFIVYGKDLRGDMRVKDVHISKQHLCADMNKDGEHILLSDAQQITKDMPYSLISEKIGYPHNIHHNPYVVDYFIKEGGTLTVAYILDEDGHLYAENAEIVCNAS